MKKIIQSFCLLNKKSHYILLLQLTSVIFVLFVGLFFSNIPQAQASTIVVNSLADNGLGDCVTTCTLRDAIATSVGGDTITFGELSGTITLTEGPITIDHTLGISGPGANILTIDGNHTVSVFEQDSGTLTISGLTFQNFVGSYGAIYHASGDGDLIINGSIFKNNSTDDYGGVIYYYSNSSGGSLIITDSAVISNINLTNYSASIQMEGGDTLEISNSTFTNNTGGEGGAINIYYTTSATISNSTFTNNSSTDGGGAIKSNSPLIIEDSTFTNNSSIDGYAGGAIYFDGDGDLTVTDTTFTNNTAPTADAGAIYFYGNSMAITSSTFNSNSSSSGGAISQDAGTLSITNSTFSENIATPSGDSGAILFSGDGATITNTTFYANTSLGGYGSAVSNWGSGIVDIVNSTFVDNQGTDSGTGAIDSNSPEQFTITNSIFSSNTPNNCRNPGAIPTSLGHNIDSGTSCGFSDPTDLNSTDPLLDPEGLKDNGGEVETIALLEGSPAIDAGDNASAPDTDARGVERPQDGDNNGTATSDIGAYEYEYSAPPIVVPTLTTDDTATEITIKIATISGAITDLGGENATARGFKYGLTLEYENYTTQTGPFGATEFTVGLTDLSCGKTYHYQSYAENSAGTGYGPDQTFKTSACQQSSGSMVMSLSYNILPEVIPPILNTNIAGCDNRTTGFSTITGQSCLGNVGTTNSHTLNEEPIIYNFGLTTLKNGSVGEAVKELQRFLNAKLNLGLVVDGNFGPKTKAVVVLFQNANGLVADGLVGKLTKAKMNGM